MTTTDLGTRDRLVRAMSQALQQRGLHGVGLNELLTQAQAPKGVLYHHFPGGKTELAVAAIEATVGHITRALDDLLAQKADPQPTLRGWFAAGLKQLERGQFERGCPLATVALESTAEDTALRQALAQGFSAIRERIALLLARGGLPEPQARRLAALVVSTYEGALLQARVAGHVGPMADSAAALLDLLDTLMPPTP
ncbi:TetR/AcrR family transcriptional regulator [Ideonella paludis]|nr:TetR/AcrR family transcriptional regulator [Ideonella paludis]